MIGTSLASALLALASFVATASAVRVWVPLPNRGTISDKLEYFFEHGEDYDAILFGTSRIVCGMNPAVLEPELARLGIELRIFNLGLPAVGAYEVDYYYRNVLARNFESLQLVMVEAWWGPPIALDRNSFSHRRIEWHSLRQTLAAVGATLREPRWSFSERLRQAVGHLQHFAWRGSNYGRGQEIAQRWLDSEPSELSSIAEAQGYRPWKPKAAGSQANDREARVSWSRPRTINDSEAAGVDLELYRGQVTLAEERGMRMVHVLLPGFREPFPDEALRGVVAHLIDYRPPPSNRERSLPHLAFLNDTSLRVDSEHLNPEGTRRFSQLVAKDLARILNTDP